MRAPALAVLAGLAASAAGCGGDGKAGQRDPFTAARQGQTPSAARKAAPRWEHLARLGGNADSTQGLRISRRALQWRVRWRCSAGRIAFSATPRLRSDRARAGGVCPGEGSAGWSQLGPVRLRVGAAGRWTAVVEQQFDTGLQEPPLPGMRSAAARVLGHGRFYRMEGRGEGRALLFRLPTGRLALRLEDFRIPPTAGMFLWLAKARRPMTTREAIAARTSRLREVKSTLGDQNYLLPEDLGPDAVRSVVIWYQPTRTAYIAAALR